MAKTTLNSLSDALAARLTKGALPGELQDFGKKERAEAAAFVAATAETRTAGAPAMELEPISGTDPRRRMRLAIVNDDMPFLVDSIAATIGAHGIGIDRIIHPVVAVTRDASGALIDVGDTGSPESMVYLELERADARDRRDLLAALERNLADVRVAVADWPELQKSIAADAEALLDSSLFDSDGEGAALLRWFLDGNLTLLGHELWRGGSSVRQLGISRHDHEVPLLAEASRAVALDYFGKGGDAPLLLKSNLISSVHRHVPLDLVLVPVVEKNKVVGLSIHAGLWTSAALGAAPQTVPQLRTRLAALEAKFGFDPKGHTGKALTHALAALPHDLVTAFDADNLENLALTAMSLADRPRPKLVLVRSTLGRHMFAFVWLPRDDLTTARRVAIGEMLGEACNGALLNWSIALEDGVVAMMRYTFDLRGDGHMPDAAPLDLRLARMVRGWVPAVEAALGDLVDPTRAARLALGHAATFPQGYRNSTAPEEAARDILCLARLEGPEDRTVRLFNDVGRAARLKIYREGGALALSDAVPVLENFGFRVIEELPTALSGGTEGFVHEFLVEAASAYTGDAKVLEDAIAAVLEGKAENDSFNRLIVDAHMAPASVVLFRAWFRYLRQAGLPYGLTTVVDALRRAPGVATSLIDRFSAAHDPCA